MVALLGRSVVLFGALIASVQVGSDVSRTRDVERDIQQVEQRREDALVRKDLKALEQIYDQDYTLISLGGEKRLRTQVLEEIRSGALTVTAMQREQSEIRVYGDVAVQTSLDSFKMHDKNAPPSGRKWVTRVYVHRDGAWRLAHVQDTLAAK